MNIDIKNTLASLADIFIKTGIKAIKALFMIEVEKRQDWEVGIKTVCKSNFVMTMGSSNDNYQALLVFAMENLSICQLLGQNEVSPQYALDVLGELGNTYCGMLMDSKEFIQSFGILKQSIPTVYVNGQSYMPCILGIEGQLYFKDNFITIRYAIQKK
ncbi:MAG: hypothetical protein HQK77_15650 [Desulfobacterales bacterium]|nr:hypothetical protein [Desulfobacterales bacterium]